MPGPVLPARAVQVLAAAGLLYATWFDAAIRRSPVQTVVV